VRMAILVSSLKYRTPKVFIQWSTCCWAWARVIFWVSIFSRVKL